MYRENFIIPFEELIFFQRGRLNHQPVLFRMEGWDDIPAALRMDSEPLGTWVTCAGRWRPVASHFLQCQPLIYVNPGWLIAVFVPIVQKVKKRLLKWYLLK